MQFKRISIILVSLLFLTAGWVKPADAYEIKDDPQYVTVNFANFYFANWQAPEKEWRQTVKPKIIAELRRWKALLSVGTPGRRLAWSALLEYMNFPKDQATQDSAYAVQLKRILEVAEEEDLPVFVPLNGVQWWDEQPELWNYWDKDGNQTPGCTNADYKSCPFSKLRNPEYRKRFIAGYNPENKWNVDWKDWNNPMGFGIRNWGDGDIYVAPAPDIVSDAFTRVNTARFGILTKMLAEKADQWGNDGKDYLFAGMSIGTEVTLNGALTPGDENYRPYGYRAVQDMFCPSDKPNCGMDAGWSRDRVFEMRREVVSAYFTRMARLAASAGLPKQRIYTHVGDEAEPGEIRYADSIGASVTYFSRPGLSLYGKAENPMGFSLLTQMLKSNGYPQFAAPEFSPLIKEQPNWSRALARSLDNNTQPVKLIDVYNERDIDGSAAVPELKSVLQSSPPDEACTVGETAVLTGNDSVNPAALTWKPVDDADGNQSIEIWKSVPPKTAEDKPVYRQALDSSATRLSLDKMRLSDGVYWWAIKREGCGGERWTVSTPHFFVLQHEAGRNEKLRIGISRFLYRLFALH